MNACGKPFVTTWLAARSLLFAEDPPWPQNWDSHNRTTLNFGFIVAQNTPVTMKTLKVSAERQKSPLEPEAVPGSIASLLCACPLLPSIMISCHTTHWA